jgi:hypothetical protein
MNFKEYLIESHNIYSVNSSDKDNKLRKEKAKQQGLVYAGWGIYQKNNRYYSGNFDTYIWNSKTKDFIKKEKKTRKNKKWENILPRQEKKLGLKYISCGKYEDKQGNMYEWDEDNLKFYKDENLGNGIYKDADNNKWKWEDSKRLNRKFIK